MAFTIEKYPIPKRFRHHISPNTYIALSELKKVPEFYPPLYEDIEWSEVYKNGLPPKYLDIGCGFGGFMFKYADLNPDGNILGIEIRQQPYDYMLDVIEKESLGNVHTIRYSVANKLPFIENESIEKIFYFFPDPWYKKKHTKRRAFNLPFLEECYRVLKNGGELLLQTDVPEVHEYQVEMLKDYNKFEVTQLNKEDNWDYPSTNQEVFCIRKERPFDRVVCIKKI
jgi:tRNA (guanine-N7-)-methyltransferase